RKKRDQGGGEYRLSAPGTRGRAAAGALLRPPHDWPERLDRSRELRYERVSPTAVDRLESVHNGHEVRGLGIPGHPSHGAIRRNLDTVADVYTAAAIGEEVRDRAGGRIPHCHMGEFGAAHNGVPRGVDGAGLAGHVKG